MTLARFVARKLTPSEIDAEVRTLVADCTGSPGLLRILLFGSAARGEMTEASDLDAVLVFSTPREAKQASREIPARRSSRWPTDLLCVDRETYDKRSRVGGVLFIARTEGRVVYEKTK